MSPIDILRRANCDLCNAEHPATPENRNAAVDENIAGAWLKHLAVCGAQLLEKERRDHA